ncbi:MAG: penicillin-binding transpeptidase domain-containing protein, partial [Pseudomonadota bacterium]
LKPFVYALAMDVGLIHPYSLMDDTAKRFAAFTPENFDRRFAGPIIAQDALIYSRNVPAVDLLNRLGQQRFHRFLTEAGVSGLRPASFYGLASVLGGNELSMVEIAQLYAMLANGGRWQPARFLAKDPIQAPRRLLSPEASFLTLQMLTKNPPAPGFQPPGQRQSEIAWKTGTSFAFRDAWAVGVVGPYTLAVWTGNFDGSSNNAFVGRTASGPLFFSIIESLADRLKNTRHSLGQPAATLSLAQASMCIDSGDLAGAHCPRTIEGYLIPGVSPIKVSKVYRRVAIDTKTGLRACQNELDSVEFRTYAFWPSKAAAAMRSAGIHLRQAPAWNPTCTLDQRAAADRAPRISTPLADSTYHSRKDDPSRNTIELQADVASDVQSVYWFANKVPLGRSTADKGLLWQLQPGIYELTAIDDAGRTDQTQLRVN